MAPFPIPIATQVVSMKQYRIPGGHEEASAIIKEYVEAGVLKICTTSWNNPIWPVRKTDGTWKMTLGPVELRVSAVNDYVNWSLWQKQGRTRKPLGFWSRKLPPAGVRYTPF